MKWFLTVFSLMTLAQAEARATHLPPSFSYQNDKAVFVDFTDVTYRISYDITGKAATVKAEMNFLVSETGHPLFDLIEEPTKVTVDGRPVGTSVIQTPNRETSLRVLKQKLSSGAHRLEIEVPLTTLVTYVPGGVKSAFWVTDLEDRFYLERYIPTNLEYDNMKMTFLLDFKGRTLEQHVFANGTVTWSDADHAKIVFPDYFTMNSLYFHTTPVGTLDLKEFTFNSIDGREVPVVVYTAKGAGSEGLLANYKKTTLEVMAELEQDYGAFRHQSVTIYNASLSHMGLGGMEYAGATVTNLDSLAHELFHSYFGRGVSPANGNAGWIDEALASWRDDGYDRRTELSGSSRMAAHPTYTRKTDTAAYSFGARFMAFLDGQFSAEGGLKPFLNSLLKERLFVPIVTDEFIQLMEKFYGKDLKGIFKKYVFDAKAKASKEAGHPIHRKMSARQLEQIL